MRKIALFFAAALAVLSAGAQKNGALSGTKFFDNWSVTVNGGVNAPVTNCYFWKNMRPSYGVGLNKQISPVFGLTFEAVSGNNLHHRHSQTALSNVNAFVLSRINLSNLFAGYKKAPRVFEIEGVFGGGIIRYFGEQTDDGYANWGDIAAFGTRSAHTSWGAKAGLNLNFNLGEKKAWTISVKPAIVWDLEGSSEGVYDRNLSRTTGDRGARFDLNDSHLELLAGVTYHFKNSNGLHHFGRVREYDQAEVDGLNAKINAQREEVAGLATELGIMRDTNRRLQRELDECNNRPVVEVERRIVKENNSLESMVHFRQGKSVIDASQLPNVERVATYLSRHPESKVVIKGYASPEGSQEINEKLAAARAEAVKDCLVKRYRIAASRIAAQGLGVGDFFSEPDWNRVAICTIEEVK
ncbi:MAG: OmpA family protein [Prevotellaceae bacterium]|nr:OmpA family protein [Prevotellaceae bacterium]